MRPGPLVRAQKPPRPQFPRRVLAPGAVEWPNAPSGPLGEKKVKSASHHLGLLRHTLAEVGCEALFCFLKRPAMSSQVECRYSMMMMKMTNLPSGSARGNLNRCPNKSCVGVVNRPKSNVRSPHTWFIDHQKSSFQWPHMMENFFHNGSMLIMRPFGSTCAILLFPFLTSCAEFRTWNW